MGISESIEIRVQYGQGIRDFLSAADRFDRGGTDTQLASAVHKTTSNLYRYSRKDELPRLLQWGQDLLLKKKKLETDVATIMGRVTQAETRNVDLTTRLNDATTSLRREINERRLADDRATAERRQLEQQHQMETDQLQATYAQQVHDMQTTYQRELRVQQARFTDQLAARDREIKKLQGQLLVSHDKNLAWPDEVLKIRLSELRRVVDNATARLAAGGLVPRDRALSARLDPGQLLPRVRGKTHFWLRSMVWSALQSAFFSLPFGFGAFGPGAGVTELLGVYEAWRARLDGRTGLDPRQDQTFELFRQSPLSNKWRSITFQSLALQVLGDMEQGNANPGILVRLGRQNVEACIRQLMDFLTELSNISTSPLYSDLEAEVRTMAELTFQIALQFGVNQARLSLLSAARGDSIVIGSEFHDCEDGEEHRGVRTHVDFVVSPGLVRFGDGKSELAKKYMVLPCEIFADES